MKHEIWHLENIKNYKENEWKYELYKYFYAWNKLIKCFSKVDEKKFTAILKNNKTLKIEKYKID